MSFDVRLAAIAALLATTLGCVGEPEPGEYGQFRYVGNVRGATPLPLVPPISDRDGNAYVLYGAGESEFPVSLFVGGKSGGWTGGCDESLNLETAFRVHGFVGRAQTKAWYWSGEALVAAFGSSGRCERVLDEDPGSGARLLFKGVVPWVRETPSRLTTLAFVQAQSDPRPFTAVIDLDRNIYTNIQEFDPGNASDVEVLGTGGNLAEGEGVFVVRYSVGETVRTQARFYDKDGTEIDSVTLTGLDATPEYGFVGFIKSDDQGLYAGLDAEGQLLLFDKSGGKRRGVKGMTPVGVHAWEGKLYVVGMNGNKPKIAPITAEGSLGKTRTWNAAKAAAANLSDEIDVIDDRSLPSRDVTWDNPRSAMGPHIFVHPNNLDHYADGTTTWLFGGPTFAVAGEPDGNTAIAYAPVGIQYEE